jgi:hypothetical protein
VIAHVLADIPTPIDAVKAGAGVVSGFVADQASDRILEPIGRAIAEGLAGAAKKVADEVLHFITSSATVSFDQGWWAGDRAQALVRQIATLALFLTLLCLLLAVIQGLLAGDVGSMVRATMLEVPVTIAATLGLVAVTQLLLSLVDAASAAVLDGVPEALGHYFAGFGDTANSFSNGFAGSVMVGVFLAGAILVWIELVVRNSLIYLLVAFAPLTLAARVWPAARGVWRRLAELGLALIVSKFAIALCLALGAAAVAGGGPKEGDLGTQTGMDLASMLTGASLMLLAAFTPFVVLKLLPIVEAAVIAQGISRSPARAAQSGMQLGYYGQGLARRAGGRSTSNGWGRSDGGGRGGDGPGTGPPRPPVSTGSGGSGDGGTPGAPTSPLAGPSGPASGTSAPVAAPAPAAAGGPATAAATIPVGAMTVASSTAQSARTTAGATAPSAPANSQKPSGPQQWRREPS